MDQGIDGAWKSPQFRTLLAEGQPGRALALVRREMGLSQADFGALLHWDRTHAGRVERGEVGTIFDVRELVRAADALGIPAPRCSLSCSRHLRRGPSTTGLAKESMTWTADSSAWQRR